MLKRPIIIGSIATSTQLLFFVALVAAISGWPAMQAQFAHFWYYLVPLALGFGAQVGMYVYLRAEIRQSASRKVMVVTGSTSTGAMVSCCAHYLANIIPFVGVSGAAALIGQYQVALFWIGLLFNAFGILTVGKRIITMQKQQRAGMNASSSIASRTFTRNNLTP